MHGFHFLIAGINRVKARVSGLTTEKWIEQVPINITWDPVHLGDENQTVDIQLARFSVKTDGQVFLHGMSTIIRNQLNSGEAQFTVPKREEKG